MADNELKQALIHGSPKIALNQAHYEQVIAAKGDRRLAYEGVLHPETGDAFYVEAGQVIRVEQRHERTQIADWWWVSPDLAQWQVMANTGYFEGLFIGLYSRVWSNIRGMRPMATMVADEVPDDFTPPGWVHHFWGYHCSPTWHQAGWPDLPPGQNACHVNAMQGFHRIPAIHAIDDEDERREAVQRLASLANYQTFQPLRLAIEDGQFSVDGAPGGPVPHGTGVEYYAEQDAYVVLSSCPWVDQSGNVGTVDPVPLYISVWDTGITPRPAPTWTDWQGAFYDAVAAGDKDITPRTPGSYLS